MTSGGTKGNNISEVRAILRETLDAYCANDETKMCVTNTRKHAGYVAFNTRLHCLPGDSPEAAVLESPLPTGFRFLAMSCKRRQGRSISVPLMARGESQHAFFA